MGTPAADSDRLAEVLRRGGEPAVAALLEAHGVALYEYFRLMLGEESATNHALTDTVVAALAHIGRLTDPRRMRAWLLALARIRAHEFYPVGWDEIAERYLGSVRGGAPGADPDDGALRVITDAALLRMWPLQREIFIISAPRYQIGAADLAAIFGLTGPREADALNAEAVGAFRQALELSASEAGYILSPGAHRRAAVLIGGNTVSVSLRDILTSCIDPRLEAMREEISSRYTDLGADGFPVTAGLAWDGGSDSDTVHIPWPEATQERSWNKRRVLITAAASTGVLVGAGVPIALAGMFIFSTPAVRGAPAQASTSSSSHTAVPSATQTLAAPSPAASSSSAAAAAAAPGATTAAPASSTPARPRRSSSPSPSRTRSSSPKPSPTATSPSPTASASPSASASPTGSPAPGGRR